MAKNNWVKWVIGLSSVASFVGFIGISKQYDANQQHKSNDGVKQYSLQEQPEETSSVPTGDTDPVVKEWVNAQNDKQQVENKQPAQNVNSEQNEENEQPKKYRQHKPYEQVGENQPSVDNTDRQVYHKKTHTRSRAS